MNYESNSFSGHLKEAIAINRERKKIYAEMTGRRSLCISWALIFFETGALAAAGWVDRQASKFHKIGIPIIEGNIVPMLSLPFPDAPPLYRGRATKEVLSSLKGVLKKYRRSMKEDLKRNDFISVAERSYELLQEIRRIEEGQGCHFAMTRHLIESIGFAALHAPGYAEASSNATVSLSKKFIQMQVFGLACGLCLDKKAQALHGMGAGILVNDVPHIPFESEFPLARRR